MQALKTYFQHKNVEILFFSYWNETNMPIAYISFQKVTITCQFLDSLYLHNRGEWKYVGTFMSHNTYVHNWDINHFSIINMVQNSGSFKANEIYLSFEFRAKGLIFFKYVGTFMPHNTYLHNWYINNFSIINMVQNSRVSRPWNILL